ncbi:inositol polyphosphate multikinase [Orussus abietinus]|uniref:inositol polyphosphate multikinase n=1 Tax=Orussus abietinus TaxID=222816 RepID=UPI00062508D9|nr:inositol polyphosphate multikinase [Orussus abietinus]
MATHDLENFMGSAKRECQNFSNGSSSISYKLPDGMVPLDSQVGGHAFSDRCGLIGILRGRDCRVLKSCAKKILSEREIAFYERLQDTADPLMRQLRQVTPRYYGTTEMNISGNRVKFLVLQDITAGMSEPCVMDIKIGRRTWDPLASSEKEAYEKCKYAESKGVYGFCIPGFQVYCLSTGCLRKYGKDFGKTLNAETIVEALGMFLNAKHDERPHPVLMEQLLTQLRRIRCIFRHQKKLRFYSSSLLVVYDASVLQSFIGGSIESANFTDSRLSSIVEPLPGLPNSRLCQVETIQSSRNLSISSAITLVSSRPTSPDYQDQNPLTNQNGNDGENKGSPIERSRNSKRSRVACFQAQSTPLMSRLSRGKRKNKDPEHRGITPTTKLERNNYTKLDINRLNAKKVRGTNCHGYEPRICNQRQPQWVTVKMIDFAHIFPAEDDSVDSNYLEGLENLIKLLETFLM